MVNRTLAILLVIEIMRWKILNCSQITWPNNPSIYFEVWFEDAPSLKDNWFWTHFIYQKFHKPADETCNPSFKVNSDEHRTVASGMVINSDIPSFSA